MRTSKYVGFMGIGLGALLLVGGALLPVSTASDRLGPFKVGVGVDNCGPAGIVAVQDSNPDCVSVARHRLLSTSALGLVVMAVGMALFAGTDDDHSRIDVPVPAVKPPAVKRRSLVRSPGSRRYTPG